MLNSEQRRLLLESVQSDQRLSALARTLMLYLLASNAGNPQAKSVKLESIAEELGLPESTLRLSAMELAADDYVRLIGEGPETKFILLCDGAEPAHPALDVAEAEPLGGRVFAEAMASLAIPKNLQPYYSQIYYSLAGGVREFVVPENSAVIQSVLDHVSVMMDAGEIDYRGPTGLIVFMLRRSAQVPRRDFGD